MHFHWHVLPDCAACARDSSLRSGPHSPPRLMPKPSDNGPGPTARETPTPRSRRPAEQQKELTRPQRLQKERQLDAADMGAAEADPAGLDRYRAKQKQTHNRHTQKRQAVTKRGRRDDTTLKPGTPTWTDDANWNELTQSTFRSCALRREPCLAAAHVFVCLLYTSDAADE